VQRSTLLGIDGGGRQDFGLPRGRVRSFLVPPPTCQIPKVPLPPTLGAPVPADPSRPLLPPVVHLRSVKEFGCCAFWRCRLLVVFVASRAALGVGSHRVQFSSSSRPLHVEWGRPSGGGLQLSPGRDATSPRCSAPRYFMFSF